MKYAPDGSVYGKISSTESASGRGIYASNGSIRVKTTRGLFAFPASVADNLPTGSAITSISVPVGYSLLLLNDCGGRFSLTGSSLVTGATIAEPGVHRPIIYAYRTLPILSGPDSYEISPEITFIATRTPADISGLLMSNVIDDVVLSGSDISTIPGRDGTSVTLTGASSSGLPSYIAGQGPNDKGFMKCDALRDRLTFTAQTPAIMTLLITFAPNSTTGGGAVITADNGLNAVLLGSGAEGCVTTLTFRTTGMSAAVTMTLATAARIAGNLRSIVALMVEVDTVGQTAKAWVNGVSAGNAVTLTGATAQTYVEVLSGSGGTSMQGAYWTSLAMWNKALSSTERDQAFAMRMPWRSRDYLFSASGNDSNTGWNSTYPKLAIDTFVNVGNFYPNDRILANGGDRFPITSTLSTAITGTASQATVTGPVILGAYGVGFPILSGSTIKKAGASAWTSIGGGVYTTSFSASFSPSAVWLLLGGFDEDTGAPLMQTLLSDPVANGNWRFAWTANVLSITTDGVVDPNTYDIEIPTHNSQAFLNSRINWTYQDFILRGFEIEGAFNCSGNGLHLHRTLGYCCASDVWDTVGGTGIVCSSVKVYQQGTQPIVFNASSTSADGASAHGATQADWYNCTFKASFSYGVADQQAAITQYFDCKFFSNAKNAYKIADGATAGTLKLERCYIERLVTTTDGSFTFDDGVTGGLSGDNLETLSTITATNTKFLGLGTVRGKAVNMHGGLFIDGGGNTFIGFNTLS